MAELLGQVEEAERSDSVLVVRDLAKRYTLGLRPSMRHGLEDLRHELRFRSPPTTRPLRDGEFLAVADVSFTLSRGGSLGILGRNGAGKSTLLRLLAGITKPDAGEVVVNGRTSLLLDASAGANPLLTGRENIKASCQLWGVEPHAYADIESEIIDFSGLGELIDAPYRTYSKGMRMRLGFSISTGLDPDLLLIDEALAVGDAEFQRKCSSFIREYLDQGGSLVFVSHSMLAVQAVCRDALVLHEGRVLHLGDVQSAARAYAELVGDGHPAGSAGSVLASRGASYSAMHPNPEPAKVYVGDASSPRNAEPGGDADAEAASADTSSERPATFQRVAIGDGRGGPVSTHGTVIIEAQTVSRQSFSEVIWGALVYSADATTCLLGAWTGDAATRQPLEAGHTSHRLRLDDVPLEPGVYSLRLATIDAETGMPVALLGIDTPALLFEVTGPRRPPERLWTTLGQPLLTIGSASWQVEAVPSGEHSPDHEAEASGW